MNQPLTQDPRWKALVARDSAQDGAFVYAVKTTGIYCRPSCPARRPNPENVEFLSNGFLAERAGYRPCKRCKPTGPHPATSQVLAMCRILEESEDAPTLEELGGHVGLSSSHAQRVFSSALGMSPREYRAWHGAQRARRSLASGTSVTEAIYEGGFSSSGRFYEKADEMLGMTPTKFKKGGAGVKIQFAVAQCSLGAVLVAATARGVCAISLGEDPQALIEEFQQRFDQAELVGGDSAFEKWVAMVIGLIEQPNKSPVDLPLDVQGTAFQCRVWKALGKIPPGKTATYSEIARSIGAPKSYRAVAQACGANTLAVAIPCHRVVRTDGSLSGYRWGVERKRTLLEREGARAV